MKNAAPTALAVMGLQVGYLMGGSIPCGDRFLLAGNRIAAQYRHFSARPAPAAGHHLVLALFFVLLNLLVDILQTTLDPRIKRS